MAITVQRDTTESTGVTHAENDVYIVLLETVDSTAYVDATLTPTDLTLNGEAGHAMTLIGSHQHETEESNFVSVAVYGILLSSAQATKATVSTTLSGNSISPSPDITTLTTGWMIRGWTALPTVSDFGIDVIINGTTTETLTEALAAGDIALLYAFTSDNGSGTPVQTPASPLIASTQDGVLGKAYDLGGGLTYTWDITKTTGTWTVLTRAILMGLVLDGPDNVAVSPDAYNSFERRRARAKALPFYLDSGVLRKLS